MLPCVNRIIPVELLYNEHLRKKGGGVLGPSYSMIARYTRPQMGAIWTDQGRLERWLEVELAASDVLAERGVVPREAAARIRERARVDAARVLEIEARVRHDVIAFTLAVGETIGDPEAARWLHYGLTSTYVVDTPQRSQVREARRRIDAGLTRPGEA